MIAYAKATIFIVFIVLFLLWYFLRYTRYSNAPHCTKKVSYKDFPWKSGDLILTCTKTTSLKSIVSIENFVKFFTQCPYHHTAIVYVDPRTKQVYFWEMNGNGTCLSTMEDMFEGHCDKWVAVRSLNKAIDTTALEAIMVQQRHHNFNLDICLAWYHRYFFPYVPIPFLQSIQWNESTQRTCAQMTTEAYILLGVLRFRREYNDPSAIFAVDYAMGEVDPTLLPMNNGYKFNNLVLLYNH